MTIATRWIAMTSRFTLTLFATLALAACSPSQKNGGNSVSTEGKGSAPAKPAATTSGKTIGGDGSAITLNPLSAKDIEVARLGGELACSFATGNAAPLLLARGDVKSEDPAFGVVKVGDYVEQIAAPGGYDAMLDGISFVGRGKTVIVAITGDAAQGGESPPRPATLTYQRTDGAERSFAGNWTCGP